MYHGVLVMTGTGPAMLNPAMMADQPESEVIDTRFGKVTIYPRSPIIFPNGLLGMPDKMQFSLCEMPSPKMARFKLLQSLEDPNLSFITLPTDLQNPFVDLADMQQAASDLELPLDHLSALFIVSVHREPSGVKLSINARAPILLHAVRRLATQHVFHNAKYQIRQPLTL